MYAFWYSKNCIKETKIRLCNFQYDRITTEMKEAKEQKVKMKVKWLRKKKIKVIYDFCY